MLAAMRQPRPHLARRSGASASMPGTISSEERRAGMRALIDMLAQASSTRASTPACNSTEAQKAHEMLESGAVIGKLLLVP